MDLTVYSVKNCLENILRKYNTHYNCSSYLESEFVSIVNNNLKCFLFVVDNYVYIFGSFDVFFKLKHSSIFKGSSSLLLEGYMYKNNTVFLVTDILYINEKVFIKDYYERYQQLCTLIPADSILADNLEISIHPIIFHPKLINVFRECFVYKNELKYLEKVYTKNSVFKKMFTLDQENILPEKMIVTKEKISDVYTVTDLKGKNKGILYVKGIKESRELKNMFKDNTSLQLVVNYNHKFKKWFIQY
jgi:hypothetical protein